MRATNPSLLVVVGLLSATARADEQPLTLARVNDAPITERHVEQVLLRGHDTAALRELSAASVDELLQKAIDDELLWQDAAAMGMHEHPAMLEELQKQADDWAVAAFVAERFQAPNEVPESEVRAFFERYYFKLQLRQISVMDAGLAASLQLQVKSDPQVMAALATEFSVDSRSIREGLHNLKYWGDVEEAIRQALPAVEPGTLSRIFRYNEAYSFVLVEAKEGVDEAAFEKFAPAIRTHLRVEARNAAWEKFADGVLAASSVVLDDGARERIEADAALVLRGEFRNGSTRPALRAAQLVLSEGALRAAISSQAMTEGQTPFAEIFEKVLREESRRLAMAERARAEGFADRPELRQAFERKQREAVIGLYLEEMVVPRIRFRHDEFEAYYQDHLDEFRGAEEVRLDMLVLADEAKAREAHARLESGADFGFVKEQYAPKEHGQGGSPEWAAVTLFSDAIREQLGGLPVGGSSEPIETRTGWLIFKLENRRVGEPKTLAEVDPLIRQIMYRQKFQSLVEEHLRVLRERSDIEIESSAIARYAGASE